MPDTKASSFEEQLKTLCRKGVIDSVESERLLEKYNSELRERVAVAVSAALEGRGQEIMELKKQVHVLTEIAESKIEGPKFDPRTGLLLGDYFDTIFPMYVESYCTDRRNVSDRRHGAPCLILGDIRNLKMYNDNFGHTYGDMLVKAVADTIMGSLRVSAEPFEQSDLAVRSNRAGDEVEILIVPPPRGPLEAYDTASHIKDAFNLRKDWSEYSEIFNEPELRPNIDFGAVALQGSSLRGILKGLDHLEKKRVVADLIAKWRQVADSTMYRIKKERADHVGFGWFKYVEGQLVDITHEVNEIKRVIGLRQERRD